ncbi:MAG: rRNA (cytosine1962-C5)-methyltransferase [Bacteroidales bacterium]|jgi:23S rRNA (cytosine1962-C5)-methyltransferase|nr:rRNA (cytosine1962-C5)-methyltransferase [Bacteroidales bacterium]MDN5329177.1 rRNA (cytosine1962-C5)-methyltransferase [Bacteroidales bacterium]
MGNNKFAAYVTLPKIEELERKITLNKGREASVLRMHPWIFSGAIWRKEGDIQPGDMVEVCDYKGNTLGFGLFEEGSLQIRMVDFGPNIPDEDFWRQKLVAAYELRKGLGLIDSTHTNAFRFIHAEGDGFPGLVADFYNGIMVMQAQTPGMYRLLPSLAGLLPDIFGARLKAIYAKPAEYATRYDPSLKNTQGFIWGNAEEVQILENGNRFWVDYVSGQKTGFFIDQRDNRNLVALYAKGRRVLNCFSYSGGFSVYALKAGAELVHSVDSSAKAIEACRNNLLLNGFDPEKHSCIEADVLQFLARTKAKYDLIVLDPPAFAKHLAQKLKAIKAYRYINRLAISQASPGSFLFTFSCSQVVDIESFRSMVLSAAIEAERDVKLLHVLRQPPDHPVSIFQPEAEYLKGLVLYIS